MEALGMIEVHGFLAAVEALDNAVKAANVSLVEVTKVTGGLVAIMVSGDVGATKAAIDAGAAAAARLGSVVSVHVIARPAAEIDKLIGANDAEAPNIAGQLQGGEKTVPAAAPQPDNLTEGAVAKMTVEKLRSLARSLPLPNVTKQEIRFAKKKELVTAIINHLKGERQ